MLALSVDAKKKSKQKVDIDVRTPQAATFAPQQVYQQCDPDLPNLSVSDFNLTDKSYANFKKKNSLFILGMSDSTCQSCCTSEPLLNKLRQDFQSGNYMNKVWLCHFK